MDLSELKKRREAKLLEHKRKKRAYYLKSKINKKQNDIKRINSIDYEVELFGGNFAEKLRDIARKQKLHIQSREEVIKKKIEEYRTKKQKYYEENKEIRLEYDKEYRDKKKEKLKEYRKEYYRQNKDKILEQQKQNRLNKKLEK
jgi:hypothetical protein